MQFQLIHTVPLGDMSYKGEGLEGNRKERVYLFIRFHYSPACVCFFPSDISVEWLWDCGVE